MPILVNTGSFHIDNTKAVGEVQTISGLGFQPAVYILSWTGTTTSGREELWVREDTNFGLSVVKDSEHRFCVVNFFDDNVGFSNSFRSQSDIEAVRVLVVSGSAATAGGLFDAYTMDSDGFSLICDKPFTKKYRVNYFALGGNSLTNVCIGSGTLPTTSGLFDVTNVGFQPDFLLLTTQMQTSFNTSGNDAALSLGWTDGTRQAVMSQYSKDNQNITYTRRYGYTDDIYASINTTGTIDYRGSFNSFTPSGFRINHLEGTVANTFYFLALKGGQYHVGTFNSRGDTNDIIVSGISFKPKALMLLSPSYPSPTKDTAANDLVITIGYAISPDVQISQSVYDANNFGTSYVSHGYAGSGMYYCIEYEAMMRLISFNDNGFTARMVPGYLDLDDWITYVAFGDTLSTSNIHAFVEGQIVRIPAYVRGQDIASSSKAGYIRGSTNINDSTNAFMNGMALTVTSKMAYVHGKSSSTDSIYAFTLGGINTSVKAFVQGYSPNYSTISAYMRGVSFGPRLWTS